MSSEERKTASCQEERMLDHHHEDKKNHTEHGEDGCVHADEETCGCGHHHSHLDEETCGHHHSHSGEEECGCGHEHGGSEQAERKKMIVRISLSGALLVIGLLLRHFTPAGQYVQLLVFLAAYCVIGYDVAIGAVRGLLRGHLFGESFLMSVSSIGAMCIGEYPEAVAVMLFYQLGEMLEDLAVDRSRDSIAELMDIRPDSACVKADNGWITVHPEKVPVGSVILIRPGERVPLDGVIVRGSSSLDTSALTGESVPRRVSEGESVLSGCINETGVLEVKTTKNYSESTASKIIDLVENAAGRKAPSERFITRFARYYTPIVVGIAVLVAVIPSLITGNWAEWIHRSFVFLVISCPCALVISVPLTLFGGLGAASKHGILMKGSNYLEALNHLSAIVFDKTGTLTKGEFAVQAIRTVEGVPEEELLTLAASAEQFSNHPIARSILSKAGGRSLMASDVFEEISGNGVRAEFAGTTVYAGNEKLLLTADIPFEPVEDPGTKVYVARDGRYLGCILISDSVKPDSFAAVCELKSRGIRTVMLTGDGKENAIAVAEAIGIDETYADLLPADKVEKIESIGKGLQGKVMFVGDGINDAPVLARADIGAAMGALGSDAAIEAADVVLMTDEPKKIVEAIDLAKATRRIVWQNIVFALFVKILFMILGVLGIAGMWVAVIGDVGVMLIAVLNAMRILKY